MTNTSKLTQVDLRQFVVRPATARQNCLNKPFGASTPLAH